MADTTEIRYMIVPSTAAKTTRICRDEKHDEFHFGESQNKPLNIPLM